MNLLNELKNYMAYNEEEERDLEQFIRFLKNNEDAFYRENVIGHVTASSWIVNKERTKILMVYHNIYDSWSWTGGHNDGDQDCLNVALKEAKEETGISEINILEKGIYSVEVLPVNGHYKRGKYVSTHLHYNVTYLFEVSEKENLRINKEENSGVKWIDIEDIKNQVNEKWMYDHVYQKLLQKLNNYKQ